MRGGGAEEKRRALAGTPDQLSFRRGLAVRVCVCDSVYLSEHWPPRILRPPVTDMFSLEVGEIKEGCEQRRGGAGESDRWMWEAIYSTPHASFILPTSTSFPSSNSTSLFDYLSASQSYLNAEKATFPFSE